MKPIRNGRTFGRVLKVLPPLQGQTVVDVGCGAGEQAALLAARGARVIGLDMNDDVLAKARARGIPDAEFFNADLRVPSSPVPADGVWCSFAAAYFIDFSTVLAAWKGMLVPGGWIAIIEIDDLFGHEPVAPRTRELLAAYEEDALAAGRYDFRMGSKLATHLGRAGFEVQKEFTIADREFACNGPLSRTALASWRSRFERMSLLKTFCGAEYDALHDDFLACLQHKDHRATGRVVCCIGVRTEA